MFTAAAAFLAVWAALSGYTCSIVVHELKGTAVQDRIYRYAYLKPHDARIEIVAGPGRGGGAAWQGGDTVRGHVGGVLSWLHLRVSIHDPRAVDLRGETIGDFSFQDVADEFSEAPSLASEETTVDGLPADAVTFPYTDAAGATRRTVYLSRLTHLPVRRVTFSGDLVVEREDYLDVDESAKLTPADFRG